MSQTSIMNMALDLLEEEPMLSPDDDRPAVRWMNRNYLPVLDSLIEGHPWNFALKRASIPALAEAPAFGWRYAFQLPSDCIRVMPLTYAGHRNGPSIPYEMEGRQILTDAAAPLRIRYLRRVTDMATMSPSFVQAFAASLAFRSANWITGKQSYAQALKDEAARLMATAQSIDSLSGTPEEPEDDSWVSGRSTGVSDAYTSYT